MKKQKELPRAPLTQEEQNLFDELTAKYTKEDSIDLHVWWTQRGFKRANPDSKEHFTQHRERIVAVWEELMARGYKVLMHVE